MIQVDKQLDAKGLSCPMPIVKTKQAITDLEQGEVLGVQATDKGSKTDIEAWARSVGSVVQLLITYHHNQMLISQRGSDPT